MWNLPLWMFVEKKRTSSSRISEVTGSSMGRPGLSVELSGNGDRPGILSRAERVSWSHGRLLVMVMMDLQISPATPHLSSSSNSNSNSNPQQKSPIQIPSPARAEPRKPPPPLPPRIPAPPNIRITDVDGSVPATRDYRSVRSTMKVSTRYLNFLHLLLSKSLQHSSLGEQRVPQDRRPPPPPRHQLPGRWMVVVHGVPAGMTGKPRRGRIAGVAKAKISRQAATHE